MDEWLPPFIRDSYWFMYPFFFFLYKGKGIRRKMHFKSLAYKMTEKEYEDFYNEIDCISGKRPTDTTEKGIRHIIRNIIPDADSVIDIGCGKGYILKRLKEAGMGARLYGLDMSNKMDEPFIQFVQGSITRLPLEDKQFDVVICTHTIEHIVPLETAINELIRITKKQLIIVTPWQRYFYYTLDGHLNFFYDQAELLRYLPYKKYSCDKIDMDWVYIGYRDEV